MGGENKSVSGEKVTHTESVSGEISPQNVNGEKATHTESVNGGNHRHGQYIFDGNRKQARHKNLK